MHTDEKCACGPRSGAVAPEALPRIHHCLALELRLAVMLLALRWIAKDGELEALLARHVLAT